jgi:hypothetical protein
MGYEIIEAAQNSPLLPSYSEPRKWVAILASLGLVIGLAILR